MYIIFFLKIYLPKINLKIYLPNAYYSKPEFPSQCQMDPASICCSRCLSLRLLLSLDMNVLVTPESNPRELVRVKMLKLNICRCTSRKPRVKNTRQLEWGSNPIHLNSAFECVKLNALSSTLLLGSGPPTLLNPSFRATSFFIFFQDPKLFVSF